MGTLKVSRVYDENTKEDGQRILIDRLWPRGVSKEEAAIDEWAKEITPTNELRKQYHEGLIDQDTFFNNYRKELEENEDSPAFVSKVEGYLRVENVTLVTSVKNISASHVPVLCDFLEKELGLKHSGKKD